MTNPGKLGNDLLSIVVDLKNQIAATYNYSVIAMFGANFLPGQANDFRSEITNSKAVS